MPEAQMAGITQRPFSRLQDETSVSPVPGQSSATPNGGDANCRLKAGQRAALQEQIWAQDTA